MDDHTAEALEGSIRKWWLIAWGGGLDCGCYNCPLCDLFYDDTQCEGCPVWKATGEQEYCEGSPYEDWIGQSGAGLYWSALAGSI